MKEIKKLSYFNYFDKVQKELQENKKQNKKKLTSLEWMKERIEKYGFQTIRDFELGFHDDFY